MTSSQPRTGQARISLEFVPPRTQAQQQEFKSSWQSLERVSPEYFSVTFGAGGSTLDSTRETVLQLQSESTVQAVPHISCMAPDRESIDKLIGTYITAGINRLVVLRGDRPSGLVGPGPFQYANELVAHIRSEFDGRFHIAVACYPEFHPESENPGEELAFFKQKVDAGADAAITQYFFNADAYFRFLDDCNRVGIDVPITPGIMPITNFRQLSRFSTMCGAEIPRWMYRRLEAWDHDTASIRDFGAEVITRMCEQLLAGGAPGLHFYTLNRAQPALKIIDQL